MLLNKSLSNQGTSPVSELKLLSKLEEVSANNVLLSSNIKYKIKVARKETVARVVNPANAEEIMAL